MNLGSSCLSLSEAARISRPHEKATNGSQELDLQQNGVILMNAPMAQAALAFATSPLSLSHT